MKLAVLYVWGSLLTLTSSKLYPGSNQEAPQYVKLMPAGPCEDEDLCPYHITLPTLSIQLPKDFRDLDSMARELETLRKTVDQLRSCCIRNGQKMETWDRGGEDEQNIIISSRDGKINVLTGASEVPATEDHLGGTKQPPGERVETNNQTANSSLPTTRRWMENDKVKGQTLIGVEERMGNTRGAKELKPHTQSKMVDVLGQQPFSVKGESRSIPRGNRRTPVQVAISSGIKKTVTTPTNRRKVPLRPPHQDELKPKELNPVTITRTADTAGIVNKKPQENIEDATIHGEVYSMPRRSAPKNITGVGHDLLKRMSEDANKASAPNGVQRIGGDSGAGLGSVDVDVGTFGGDKRHPHEDNNEDSSASKTHNPIIKKGIENPGEHKESAPHSADERVSKNLPPPTIGRTEDERRDPSLQNRKIHGTSVMAPPTNHEPENTKGGNQSNALTLDVQNVDSLVSPNSFSADKNPGQKLQARLMDSAKNITGTQMLKPIIEEKVEHFSKDRGSNPLGIEKNQEMREEKSDKTISRIVNQLDEGTATGIQNPHLLTVARIGQEDSQNVQKDRDSDIRTTQRPNMRSEDNTEQVPGLTALNPQNADRRAARQNTKIQDPDLPFAKMSSENLENKLLSALEDTTNSTVRRKESPFTVEHLLDLNPLEDKSRSELMTYNVPKVDEAIEKSQTEEKDENEDISGTDEVGSVNRVVDSDSSPKAVRLLEVNTQLTPTVSISNLKVSRPLPGEKPEITGRVKLTPVFTNNESVTEPVKRPLTRSRGRDVVGRPANQRKKEKPNQGVVENRSLSMSHLLSGDKPGNSSGVEELETSWNQDGSFPVNRNKNNSHVTNLKTTPGGASKEPVELKRSNPLKVTRPGGTINEERPPNRTTVNRLKQLAENNAMNANGVTLNPHMVERAQDNHAVKNSGCNSGQCESETTQQPKRNTRVRADIAQDCSDYTFGKPKRSGIFKVRPDLRNSPFLVFCDMDSYGGGWTLLQHRYDGSISFNRSWNDYKMGFGHLKGEFWLGNDKIHLLTKTEDMLLRIELEDIDGLKAHATYEHFFVASEQQLYRLSVGTYFGTAGNAMSFSDKFNHDQKYFSTPDRDNDMYASGNCGDYYSSGWWFDSCMAANLNGKYYKTQYKGVRNGIFWGTWPNISWEYYPTNYRQAFKTVKMMIRPKDYTP